MFVSHTGTAKVSSRVARRSSVKRTVIIGDTSNTNMSCGVASRGEIRTIIVHITLYTSLSMCIANFTEMKCAVNVQGTLNTEVGTRPTSRFSRNSITVCISPTVTRNTA